MVELSNIISLLSRILKLYYDSSFKFILKYNKEDSEHDLRILLGFFVYIGYCIHKEDLEDDSHCPRILLDSVIYYIIIKSKRI